MEKKLKHREKNNKMCGNLPNLCQVDFRLIFASDKQDNYRCGNQGREVDSRIRKSMILFATGIIKNSVAMRVKTAIWVTTKLFYPGICYKYTRKKNPFIANKKVFPFLCCWFLHSFGEGGGKKNEFRNKYLIKNGFFNKPSSDLKLEAINLAISTIVPMSAFRQLKKEV